MSCAENGPSRMRNVLGLEDWASNWRDLPEALDLVPAPVGEPLVVMWFAELEEEVDTEALSLLVLRIWKIARVPEEHQVLISQLYLRYNVN